MTDTCLFLSHTLLLKFSLLLIVGFCSLHMNAQHSLLTVDEVMERVADGEEAPQELRDELLFLSQHPINLNRLSRERLKQIPFLRDYQIDQILLYFATHKRFETLYELQLIKGMDAVTIQNLLPFVVIGALEPATLKLPQLIAQSEQELFFKGCTCLQEKKGFSRDTSSSGLSSRYLGDKYAHSFRYRLTSNDQLQLSLIGDKDAGEPFFHSRYNSTGYDYYSFHAGLSNVGFLNRLVVGDYTLSFGQGLLMNSGFSIGKSLSGSNTGYTNQGIKFHYSSGENDFLRGVASTLNLGGGEYTFFYSSRHLDAIGDSVVTSFKEDGIHRTMSDFSKKNTLQMKLYGAHLQYNFQWFEFGVTALTYQFNKEISPKSKPYNLYYFRGTENTDIGLNYRLHIAKLHFFGEIAQSRNGAKASILSVQSTVTSDIQLLASYRNYAKDYQAYYANAFSESASFNEKGFLLSATYRPIYTFNISLYADWFSYPWLRYGVDLPSKGSDYRGTIDYLPSDSWSHHLDIRYRTKEKNGSDAGTLQEYTVSNIKYQTIYSFDSSWKLKSLFAYNRYKEENTSPSHGYLCSESLLWNIPANHLKVDINATLFHTDSYDSRVWLYENGGLYASSMTSLYGHGYRLGASAGYKIQENLTLWARYAQTTYSNRKFIGSALEEIKGNRKSDVSFYIQWLF
ncbi:MAG: helix-hairpin-helix domain-containing protein [Bacteroidales bacterium]|nr:helix-hairpin-helix domain-containing protein [Bacteroidales bacterium]